MDQARRSYDTRNKFDYFYRLNDENLLLAIPILSMYLSSSISKYFCSRQIRAAVR